jgi:hypothetical protein
MGEPEGFGGSANKRRKRKKSPPIAATNLTEDEQLWTVEPAPALPDPESSKPVAIVRTPVVGR